MVTNKMALQMWVIYKSPKDYPEDKFVLRLWNSTPDGPRALGIEGAGDTLDEVRAFLPEGLHRIAPSPGDDPVIVETWI